mmetsp:Transcript_33817/g.87423  ORF Transcript_33817/g.87423 Transcript_33817/m.87423 type:complete len:245 (+) Transcript_33817:931-1665(+)
MPAMNQQDLSNTSWAYARCELQNAPLLHAIAAQALRMRGAVDSRSISLIAWSLAKCIIGDEPLMTALACEALALISEASPQGLANTAWAFATSAVSNAPLFEAIAAESLRLMTQFGQQELGNTAWAFAELRVYNVPLIDAISAAALSTIGSAALGSGPDDERDRGSYAIAWAQGRLACTDQVRELVVGHASAGHFHILSFGLLIVDEEWRRFSATGGALNTLERFLGGPTTRRVAALRENVVAP